VRISVENPRVEWVSWVFLCCDPLLKKNNLVKSVTFFIWILNYQTHIKYYITKTPKIQRNKHKKTLLIIRLNSVFRKSIKQLLKCFGSVYVKTLLIDIDKIIVDL